MKPSICIVIIVSSFFSFISYQKSKIEKDLIGQWRNVYLKVVINNADKGAPNNTMEVDSSKWENVLQIKPIRTFYNANGSYRSEYYTLRDSLFQTSSGTWKIVHDSLIMTQQKPKSEIYKFKVTIHRSLAQFEGVLDFDGDGKVDDIYLGKQRKQ